MSASLPLWFIIFLFSTRTRAALECRKRRGLAWKGVLAELGLSVPGGQVPREDYFRNLRVIIPSASSASETRMSFDAAKYTTDATPMVRPR
jgi:hypothetical protein